MFKVVVNIQIQAYPLNDNGECVPPMLTQQSKLYVVDAETAEDARKKVEEFYGKAKTCLL